MLPNILHDVQLTQEIIQEVTLQYLESSQQMFGIIVGWFSLWWHLAKNKLAYVHIFIIKIGIQKYKYPHILIDSLACIYMS